MELILIAKTCLTSFWFWVPVLFAAYMWAQLGIMFYIHPLALAIIPSILIAYALIQEDRRFKAQYGLDKNQSIDTGKKLLSEVNMKRLVSEYSVLLKNDKKSQDNES
jgi:hypothetical protein